MSGALSLGWRNIWRNRRRTLISMGAIGVGLLLVIFYSGLLAGVMGDAKNQLDNGGLGHVEIYAQGFRPKRDVSAVMAAGAPKVSLPPGSESGARVLSRGLATSARGNEPIELAGVVWTDEAQLSAHVRTLTQGALPAQSDARAILVGEQLAERLGLKLGGKVRLMVMRADGEMGADLFRVRGIFHSIAPTIGKRQVYVSQEAARELVGLPGGAHQLVIQLADPTTADAVAARLRGELGEGFEVKSWGELFPVMRRMEALSNNVVFALAFFVYLLVGLGVLNTLLMSVLERTREFGVLMALGTRPNRIIRLVLAESFWIALVSVIIGAALGSLLTWHFSHAGLSLYRDAGESFQFEGVAISTLFKTRFQLVDVIKASSFVFVMALVVGLYPASRITRLQPTEALRRT